MKMVLTAILKCFVLLPMAVTAMILTSGPRVSSHAGGRIAHGHHSNPEYNALFETEGIEVDAINLEVVQGALPTELAGNFYVNGPGLMTFDHKRSMHPFDGHGFVRRFHIKDGKATLTSRFVQTKDYQAERSANRILARGTGTLPSDPEEGLVPQLENAMDSFLRNPANTCVLPWGGKLLCGHEGGLPYALDPYTLETIGLETFGGALHEGLEERFLAHTRIDEDQGLLLGVSTRGKGGYWGGISSDEQTAKAMGEAAARIEIGALTELRLHAFDTNMREVWRRDVELSGMSLFHDFEATPEHFVLLENPVCMDVANLEKFAIGEGSFLSTLKMDSRTARVVLVPREENRTIKAIDLGETLFGFHVANAGEVSEKSDEKVKRRKLLLEACTSTTHKFGYEFGYDPTAAKTADFIDPSELGTDDFTSVSTISIDLDELKVEKVHNRYERSSEFVRSPSRQLGERSSYVYFSASTDSATPLPFNAASKLNVQTGEVTEWVAAEGEAVGEAFFVQTRGGRGGDDDGYILTCAYNTREGYTDLIVLDAGSMDKIATVRFDALLPLGFHCGWLDDVSHLRP